MVETIKQGAHSFSVNTGYMHTVTFSHRFLLFGSKLEFPWDCGTIQNHAKTLPCARSHRNVYIKTSHDSRHLNDAYTCTENFIVLSLIL